MPKKRKICIAFTLLIIIVVLIVIKFIIKTEKPLLKNQFQNLNAYSAYAYDSTIILEETLYMFTTNSKEKIIRDTINSNETIVGLYVDYDNIYYASKNLDTGFLCFFSLNKDNFQKKLLYKELCGIRNEKRYSKYLGLFADFNYENKSYNDYINEEIECFWVDSNYLFTVSKNGLYMINLKNHEKELLIESPLSSEKVVYDKGVIYYTTFDNTVCSFDIVTNEIETLKIEKCKKMYFFDNRLFYINTNNHIGYSETVLSDTYIADTSDIYVSGNLIYYCDNNKNIVEYNIDSHEIKSLHFKYEIYNVYYNQFTKNLFGYCLIEGEYKWISLV